MSWKPSKPNVTLAVTRFAPDKPVAGLTPEERAAHREKRQAECAKVEPALEIPETFWMAPRLFADPVECQFIDAPALVPYTPKQYHDNRCLCGQCLTTAQHRADYDKARRIRDANGF